MVIYHALYTLGYYIDLAFCRTLFRFFSPLEPLFAGIFIFLCGLCCPLSRSNWRRGGLLALVAAAVSLVMAVGFPDDPIWFGVLHLLSTCILLYALLQKPLRRIPIAAGMAVCAVLFVLCWNLPVQEKTGFFGVSGLLELRVSSVLVRQRWLYPLGLGRIEGIQADYFPLLPWVFCFFAGSFGGRAVAQGRIPAWTRCSHLPPLSFLGRHALLIYVLHQPIIYGLGSLLALL